MSNTKTEKASASFVGFANLPNQVFRKAVKRGFQFSLMVVGQSGLGKSTLINSLFMTNIYEDSAYDDPSARMPKTTQVRASSVGVQEGGVHLDLTLVDTPGFGDVVDNSNCWQPIIQHIDSKYEEYLNGESRVIRDIVEDRRIHCCLYFIAPTGHGLKQIDIAFMKQLHEKVNIIPVIAKADTLTPEECAHFKKRILNEIHENGIKIYQFPDTAGDQEEETAANRKLREAIPFAVVGSNTIVDANNKKVRGRNYPWGVAEVDNIDHCDFSTLRNMLVRTHMQDLKDVTNNVHYENFRCLKLAGVVNSPDPKHFQAPSRDPLAQFEVEKREHEIKMRKMEREMEEVFEMKVQEKLQKLKDIEADLNRRKEQMKRALEQQQRELTEKRKQFDEDKRLFDEEHQKYMEELEASMRAAPKDTGKKKKK